MCCSKPPASICLRLEPPQTVDHELDSLSWTARAVTGRGDGGFCGNFSIGLIRMLTRPEDKGYLVLTYSNVSEFSRVATMHRVLPEAVKTRLTRKSR